MSSEVRERALLPLAVPLGIFIGIGALVIGFSRVLLSVPREVAVAVALMTALNVMAFFSVLSAKPGSPARAVALFLVVAVPVVVGAAAASGAIHVEAEKEKPKPVTVEIKAASLAFSLPELHLRDGAETTIRFNNTDSVPHNVSIYTAAGGTNLFRGDIINGPSVVDYKLKAPAAGNYWFQCDVHPQQMHGTVVVAAASGAKAAGASPSLSATNIAFDKTSLSAASGGQVTVKFTNNDTVPHNFSLYGGPDATAPNLFRGEIFAGPGSRDYTFQAPPPGTYHFQCDVHPQQMRGTVTFR